MAKIDWKSIVATVAPTIATAFGGPLAGLATSAVSEAVLGKPDGTESEVAGAILKYQDPEMLLKLKQAESAFAENMKKLDIDLERIAMDDRISARQRQVALKDWTPSILAYVYTAGYFAILGLIIFKGSQFGDDGVKDLLNILLGILSAAQVGIITYYFGSSAGSAKKSSVLEQQLIAQK